MLFMRDGFSLNIRQPLSLAVLKVTVFFLCKKICAHKILNLDS